MVHEVFVSHANQTDVTPPNETMLKIILAFIEHATEMTPEERAVILEAIQYMVRPVTIVR
jgi:hypothetical protein